MTTRVGLPTSSKRQGHSNKRESSNNKARGGSGGQAESLSRTQLPLTLAWAITIHKSQGATYDKAIVNIGEKEIALGLTYVAFSRVRTLEGLLLRGCYGVDRIMKLNLHKKHQLREEAEEWLNTLPRTVSRT